MEPTVSWQETGRTFSGKALLRRSGPGHRGKNRFASGGVISD